MEGSESPCTPKPRSRLLQRVCASTPKGRNNVYLIDLTSSSQGGWLLDARLLSLPSAGCITENHLSPAGLGRWVISPSQGSLGTSRLGVYIGSHLLLLLSKYSDIFVS